MVLNIFNKLDHLPTSLVFNSSFFNKINYENVQNSLTLKLHIWTYLLRLTKNLDFEDDY